LGILKTKDAFEKIFLEITNQLGSDRFNNFHSHFSKIEYTTGGEKRHLTFDDIVFGPDYQPVMELVHKYDLSPIFVCESAGTQAEDSKMMKDYYLSL
jgi:deoxyribonuclease-4